MFFYSLLTDHLPEELNSGRCRNLPCYGGRSGEYVIFGMSQLLKGSDIVETADFTVNPEFLQFN
jgi:hypothetical protein